MVNSLAGQLPVILFLSLMILAGAGDVLSERIPNPLVIGIIVGFFPLALLYGMASWMVVLHVTAFLALLLAGYSLFSFGFIGGGDAKLMAAAGLWLGLLPSLFFLMFTALSGGVLAAAIGFWYMMRTEFGLRSRTADRMLSGVAPNVPYGFAFAAGAILATPYSWMTMAASGQT